MHLAETIVVNSNPWQSFAFAVVGILTGALVAHLLTKSRDLNARNQIFDKEQNLRIASFRKLLIRRRYELERVSHADSSEVWKVYSSFAPEIMAEFAGVSSDITDPKTIEVIRVAGEWEEGRARALATKRSVSLRDILRDSIKEAEESIPRK